MTPFTPANLVALSLQITVVAAAAALAHGVLRIRAPRLRYAFWRAVLLLCLALPWIPVPPIASSPGAAPQLAVAVIPAEMSAPIVDAAGRVMDWTLWLPMAIAAGGALRLLWMAFGCWRLRQLRQAGEPLPLEEYADVQEAVGARAEVRYLSTAQQPVTFGVIRPVVLLPSSLRQQASAIRRAVLAHELVHVRRRDWCWVIAEEAIRAVCWFHPAIWWLVSSIQHAREEVVDRTVVALTGRRREYVEALLVFADEVPLAPAPAFARRRQLFRRITLLSTEDVMSRPRVVASAVVFVLVVIAAGWTAARAFPLETGALAGGDQVLTIAEVKRGPGPLEQSAKPLSIDNPIPGRTYGETPLYPPSVDDDYRATVTLRTTVDEAGNVAELRLGGFSFSRGGISASVPGDSFGAFSEKASFRTADGQAVTAQSMRPVFEAFILAAADAVQRWHYEPPRDGPIVFNTIVQFTKAKVTTSNMAAPPRQGISADGAIRVGGNLKSPTKIRDVRPVYPAEARDARVQGVVIIEMRVEPDGSVGDAQIVRSIPLLDQAALDAVKQWQFAPTLLNGAPVPVIMTVTIQFSLDQ